VKLTNNLWLRLICLVLSCLILWQTLPAWAQGQALQKPRPTILEFSRERCPMCEYMEDVLVQFKAKYGDQIEVRLVHIEPDENLFKQYKVAFVPTQVFLDASGKEVFRHTGLYTLQELVRKLKELKLM